MYVCGTCFGYDIGRGAHCDALLGDHAHDAAAPVLAQQLQAWHIHHVCQVEHIPTRLDRQKLHGKHTKYGIRTAYP